MRKILLITISILLFLLIYLFIDSNIFINVNVKNNTAMINKTYKVEEFIDNISNAKLLNSDKEVIFTNLGKNKIELVLQNKFSKIYKKDIEINVIDEEAPIIGCHDITSFVHEELDLINNIVIVDNSKEEIIPLLEGEYDVNKIGTYNLKYIAKDSSGNKSECTFNLTIKDKIAIADIQNNQYYVKLDKKQNVLMVYSLDTSGNYNILVKTFAISAGENTPIGIFKAKDKHAYISFSGGTYGRYATRIDGSFWFHSVPYNSLPNNGNWDKISYKEYNKLGSLASHGCIRLAVSDAKWIYDNIKTGTIIDIYEGDELPKNVVKPTSIKVDEKVVSGWDPTDPNENNPYN